MHGCTKDSSAVNPDNKILTTRYIFILSEAHIGFGAKTQTLIAQSTFEAELMVISYGKKQAVYMSYFMIELSFTSFHSVPIQCDSTGALCRYYVDLCARIRV